MTFCYHDHRIIYKKSTFYSISLLELWIMMLKIHSSSFVLSDLRKLNNIFYIALRLGNNLVQISTILERVWLTIVIGILIFADEKVILFGLPQSNGFIRGSWCKHGLIFVIQLANWIYRLLTRRSDVKIW